MHSCVYVCGLCATDDMEMFKCLCDLRIPGLVLQDAEVVPYQFNSSFRVSEAGGGNFSYRSLLLLQLWSWTRNGVLHQIGEDTLPCCKQRDTMHIKLVKNKRNK